MENFVNKLAESKFMKGLEKLSDKLSASPAFSSISGGMGGTMGLIMLGAIVQVILAIGTNFFGLETTSTFYTKFYAIYQMSMGSMGLFMTFNIAYTYSRKLKMNGVQAGFTAMLCYFLVCAPIQVASADGGASTFNAISVAIATKTITRAPMKMNTLVARSLKFSINFFICHNLSFA